jgi:EAL domain-containing protein (putative c-di-GMP-specific phosphodiesterase class I)
VVKIDKSFIDRIAPGEGGSAMVQGVIELSRALGFTCIAEGVEMDAQREVLDQLGCESAQGFLFARPGPGAEMEETLARLRVGHDPEPAISTAAPA